MAATLFRSLLMPSLVRRPAAPSCASTVLAQARAFSSTPAPLATINQAMRVRLGPSSSSPTPFVARGDGAITPG